MLCISRKDPELQLLRPPRGVSVAHLHQACKSCFTAVIPLQSLVNVWWSYVCVGIAAMKQGLQAWQR